MQYKTLTNCILLAVFATIFFGCSSSLIVNESTPSTDIKQYPVEAFFKTHQVSGGAWSADEKRLLVESNQTGIFNLYELSLEDGKMKQITNSASTSMFAIGYVPGSTDLLYRADKDGNEIHHIYLLKNGISTDLTPQENEIARFMGWNEVKNAFYYLSNKRDERYYDVYKMNISNWTSTLVHENNDFLIESISRDGKFVLLSEPTSEISNRLFLYNLTTKTKKEISGEAMPGKYKPSGFSADGTSLYYLTDAGKDFRYLMQYNIEIENRNVVYESNWDVMNARHSKDGKYRVVAINEDGQNIIRLFTTNDGKEIKIPAVPGGNIEDLSFSESGRKMWLRIGSEVDGSNYYVFDLSTNKLQKLTNTLNSEIDPKNLVLPQVIRYPSFDGLEIPAIYYKPHNAHKNNKVPAIVWVHGGPGGQSRIGEYSPILQYFLNQGYALLAVNNRGSSGYGKTFSTLDDRNHGDGDLKDCIWGKKWLQQQPEIEATKIAIAGGSYGGFMSMAAMAFHPEEFQAAINIVGVTNWIRTLRSIPPQWEAERKGIYEELGDPYTADSVRLYNISPLFHASNIKNPVMVIQGANDPRVLQVESDDIVAAIKKNGVPVSYLLLSNEGHAFMKTENQIKISVAMKEFLDKYLK